MKELVVARGGKRRAGSRAEKVPRPDTCGTKNPLRYLTKTHQSVPSCPSPYREKSKCLYERGWARLQWARVVVFGEGGVVAHQQHRVALITSSYRLGQRCGQTCCPRSADKTTAKRTKRADEERTNRWFLVFFFSLRGTVFPERTATMLLPPGALLLLLAALYSSVDLTGAEVSVCNCPGRLKK